ncbi:hypothetical protein [Cohnella silvisoli]|uniref:Squalene cyclase C-terminal domain-containing protein n=1 Tax=Cohnella silvisoli TaxID=2873699 RepID=A0ABV1L1N8_9BACL|nr:hypothetical protein [Cohnella silvisoli]MCD9025442.1 hypothetical protein [Cohnella silvisoli]
MNFEKAANFIWENGRLLERRVFEYIFLGGTKNNVLNAIKAYQNDDGGFGHALEPDLRTPESQPLYTGFALKLLYDCEIKNEDLTYKVIDYVSKSADLETGIPIILPSSSKFPRAEHWNNPLSVEPSISQLTALVGLIRWQGVKHPWLDKATDICLNVISSRSDDDAHTIASAFILLESLPQIEKIKPLFNKLSKDLYQSRFFCLEAPPQQYGLTPLEIAPVPNSYCRSIFSDKTIMDHLKVLVSQQDEDGGWPILWEPPGGIALNEWRAYRTLMNLKTLNAYNMINH